ncbi:hypothetical protein L1887_49081 [Cichorium endivia]|nr:hypothetical protein L1887_49081 [Cichorium endivia]
MRLGAPTPISESRARAKHAPCHPTTTSSPSTLPSRPFAQHVARSAVGRGGQLGALAAQEAAHRLCPSRPGHRWRREAGGGCGAVAAEPGPRSGHLYLAPRSGSLLRAYTRWHAQGAGDAHAHPALRARLVAPPLRDPAATQPGVAADPGRDAVQLSRQDPGQLQVHLGPVHRELLPAAAPAARVLSGRGGGAVRARARGRGGGEAAARGRGDGRSDPCIHRAVLCRRSACNPAVDQPVRGQEERRARARGVCTRAEGACCHRGGGRQAAAARAGGWLRQARGRQCGYAQGARCAGGRAGSQLCSDELPSADVRDAHDGALCRRAGSSERGGVAFAADGADPHAAAERRDAHAALHAHGRAFRHRAARGHGVRCPRSRHQHGRTDGNRRGPRTLPRRRTDSRHRYGVAAPCICGDLGGIHRCTAWSIGRAAGQGGGGSQETRARAVQYGRHVARAGTGVLRRLRAWARARRRGSVPVGLERGRVHRHVDALLGQRLLQPRQVPGSTGGQAGAGEGKVAGRNACLPDASVKSSERATTSQPANEEQAGAAEAGNNADRQIWRPAWPRWWWLHAAHARALLASSRISLLGGGRLATPSTRPTPS